MYVVSAICKKKNNGKDEALSYTEDSGVIYEMNKAGKYENFPEVYALAV